MPVAEVSSTLEGVSVIKQVSVVLFGCFVLLAFAFALAGSQAISSFLDTPVQLFEGAISPLGAAQVLILDATAFLTSSSATSTFGVVAAKLAAINLLPLPTLNGGAALAVIARATGAARVWPKIATTALLGGWLVLVALWLFAFVARLSGAEPSIQV